MSKIKDKLYSLTQILKKSLKKFPATIIPILILTIINAINLDNDIISGDLLGKISFFILTFSSGAFLIETINDKDFNSKILYYITSGVFSAFFTWKIVDNHSLDITRLWIAYLIITIVLGIYYCYKMSKKNFQEYVTKTFINVFKTSLIYGIFAVGFAIVTAIFVYLILGGKGYLLIPRIEILLIGIYYIPTIIYNLYEQNEEVGKFSKIVIKYVLGTLVMIAFSIIYMYIIKIIVFRKIPSNQIFRILTALFVTGLPIWTMVSYFAENGLFDKINNKLPMLFIPFIFLQIYAIGVRIFSNGITVSRYLCVMVVIFEIIYTFMYIKNKEKIGKVLWVFIVLAIISINIPYVNMFTVSNKSQQEIMRVYTKKEELSDEEIIKAYGGYKYLKYSAYGEEYITEEDKNFIDKITEEKGELINNSSSINKKSLYASNRITSINVDGYKTLYEIEAGDYSESEKGTIDKVMSNVEFKTNGKNEYTLDILSKVKEYIAHSDSIEEYFENNNEITIDSTRKLILKYFSISYKETTNEVYSYNISGYLLEK